jgi:SAM-dependent methyltransferase
MARLAPEKANDALGAEWDAVADARFDQISSGRDLTYRAILAPTVLRLAGDTAGRRILDAGCGAGFLAAVLGQSAELVVGVDLSRRSIELANSTHAAANVHFVHASVENFATSHPTVRFDVAVANATLMDVLDLDAFLASVRRVLRTGGGLAATITHPCFWPRYWNYLDCDWFDYTREQVIEAPFRISLDDHPVGWTTHVHRPLSAYTDALNRHGFELTRLVEPMPTLDVESQYPTRWEFPRYLGFHAVATDGPSPSVA